MTLIKIEYDEKFIKELKKLTRKCPSLKKDFERFEKSLITDIKFNNLEVPTNNGKYFKIKGLDKSVNLPVFIAKTFYCEKMNKGAHSGFRITFVYNPTDKLIYFIQFYYKGKNEIEDKERINNLFKN